MANTRVLTNKKFSWYVAPATAVANIAAITQTEAATFVDITAAIKFDNTNFNTQNSQSNDDRSFADASGAKTAGYQDASGSFAAFTAPASDTTSTYYIAQTSLRAFGTDLIVLARPVIAQGTALAAGTEYNAWHIKTDAPANTRGDSSYYYVVKALLQSDMAVRGIIAPTVAVAPVVTLVRGTASGAAGSIAALKAVYQGIPVTVGATWVSSDTTKATVTEHGIVTRVATGTASITCTVPGSTASTALVITIT